MTAPTHAMLVTFESGLSRDEIEALMRTRAPEFRALDGLEQKFYVHDAETGRFGGLYLWRSGEALTEYRASELAASIATAYQVVGAPSVQILEIVMPLRD